MSRAEFLNWHTEMFVLDAVPSMRNCWFMDICVENRVSKFVSGGRALLLK